MHCKEKLQCCRNEDTMSKQEKITFSFDDETVDFYVLEQTRIGGVNYILVTDTEEGDGEALILKDLSEDGEEEANFVAISCTWFLIVEIVFNIGGNFGRTPFMGSFMPFFAYGKVLLKPFLLFLCD